MLNKLRTILLLNIVSVGIHAYLALNHFKLKFAGGSEGSVCNINQKFNCDAVASSAFSEFLNIPLSIWGLGTHLVLILLLIVVGAGLSVKKESLNKKIIFILSLGIALASIVMGFIAFTQLSVYCLFCFALYALSFINLFVVYKWTGNSIKDTSIDTHFLKNIAAWAIAIPVLAFFTNQSFVNSYGGKDVEKMAISSLMDWQANPSKAISTAPSIAYGPARADAKMTITEFADFRCIHCKNAAPVLHNFVKSRTDTRLEFYSFPLDGNCNPGEGMSKGPGFSCLLAYSNYCAGKQSKGWPMNDYMFKNMTSLGQLSIEELKDNLVSYSKSLSLDSNSFTTCLDNEGTKSAIMSQAQQGVDIGVQGTPAIYINNKYVPAGHSFKTLEKIWKSLR